MEVFIKSSSSFLMLSLTFFFILTVAQGSETTAREKILVGTHLPLTGRHASIGEEQKWAYENAVADVNKTGGIYIGKYDKKFPVQLVIIDDKSSPSESAKSVLKLIKEKKVDFILSGHAAVFGVIPGCIVAETNQKYYHATTCFVTTWKGHNFKWSTLLFYDMEKSAATPFELWNSLPKKQRPKRIALITESTYDAETFGKMFDKKAIENGYQFVLKAKLPKESTDYSPQINKAKELGVDAILIYASVSESITFIQQMKRHHLKVKYFHGWKGTFSTEFGKILGKDADYVVSDGHWSEDSSAKGSRELGQRYRKEFGTSSVSVGMYYALAQILWQAIEEATTLDPQVVRTAVLHNKFDTVMGKIDYDLEGVALYPNLAFQWVDGEQVLIYPFNRAKQKLQLPANR